MSKYKVSIIVPVYNVEKYIDKCLNSLVNQTLKEIEIIVVNDGSPDNSQKIIDKYVKKYPNKIKSYIKKNGGQGSARNYGLKKANGEYIGYVDSDDFVNKRMYEKMYDIAVSKNADIVITRDSKITEDGKISDNYFFDKIVDKKTNAFFGNMGVCNKIYKKELLLKNNLEFKENVWYEDVAFTIKAIISANKIDYCIDESLYYYLSREGSTMNNSNVKRNLEILEAFDDILSYIKHNKKEEYFSIIEFLAIDHIYISAIVRVLKADANKNVKKQVINKLISYMNKNFPNYKSNEYINTLPKNRKIVYILVRKKMYKIIEMIFAVKRRGV